MQYGRKKRKRRQRVALALALSLLLSNSSVEVVLAAPDTAQAGEDTEANESQGSTGAGEGIEADESQGSAGTGEGTEADESQGSAGTGEGAEADESQGSAGTGEGAEADESQGSAGTGEGTEADESQGSAGTGEGTEADENQGSADEDAETDNNRDHTEGTDITVEEADPAQGEEDGALDADIADRDQTKIEAQKAMEPEHFPVMDVLEVPEHYDASENPYSTSFYTEASSFDSREAGILPQARNQNPWGTCWAFTTLGVLEASLAVQELADPASVDLSERHLAYFTYHTGYDVMGNADKDTVELINGANYMEKGGNLSFAALRLINWQGAAAEGSYPYPNVQEMPEDLALENAQDDICHMRNYFYVDTEANHSESIQNVKALVQEYGCAGWSYFHDNSNFNYSTNAYYNNTQTKTNHAITIVGWDDDFPKESFKEQPQNDGAWIVRNSWGADWGEDGYFYISYEDTSLGSGNSAGVMVAEPADRYDNNYFNSNTLAWDWQYGIKMAQVFTVKGLSADQELLRAVSFMTGSTNKDFEIQIYKISEPENGVLTDPEDGTPVLADALTGRTSYAGVYTVDLPEPVACNAGDIISIVISFPGAGYGYIYKDSSKDGNNIKNHNETQAGESFYAASASGGWLDMHEQGESLRINLLTDDMAGDGALIVKASVTAPEKAEEDYRVDLSWNKLTDVSEYEIYRAKTLDGTYEKIGSRSASVRLYQDIVSQTDHEEHYFYKVRAVFTDGSDRSSEPVEAVLEGKLFFGVLTLSYEEAQVKLSWDAVTGAAGYEIQRKEKNGAVYSQLAKIEDPSTTEYTDDLSREALGIYQYRIRAYNETGKYTDWIQEEIGKDLLITQTDYRHLKFTWLPAENAAYCRINIKVGDEYYVSDELPVQDTGLEYDVSELLDSGRYRVGDAYSYYLVIEDSSGAELYRTSEIAFRILPDALKINSLEIVGDVFTGNTSVENASGEAMMAVELTWSGGDGGDTVVIYRSENRGDPGEPYALVPVADGAYIDTDVVMGSTYYYWLCPTVQASTGAVVEGEMTGAGEIRIPSILHQTQFHSVQALSDTEVELTWAGNADADGYYIYRAEGNDINVMLIAEVGKDTLSYETGNSAAYSDARSESGNEISEADFFSYRDTGLTPGVFYDYRVAVYVKEKGEKKAGKMSVKKSVRTQPEEVQLERPAAAGTGKAVELQWSAAQGAEGYLVQRSLDGKNFEQIAKVEGYDAVAYTDRQISGLSGVIGYRVKAYNEAADGGQQDGRASKINSIEISFQQSTEISGFRSESDGTRVILRWNKVTAVSDGKIGYEIQKKGQQDDDYVTIGRIEDSSSTEYTDDLKEAALGIYRYRIRAYNEAGECTDWSQAAFTLDLKVSPVDYKSLNFTWLPVENADHYEIYINKTGAFRLETVQSVDTGVTCDVLARLGVEEFNVGDPYSYYVTARDSSYREIYRTSVITVRTVPDLLKIETLEIAEEAASENAAVRLSWSGGDGADTIVIYRSENPNRWGEAYATVSAGLRSYRDTGVVKGKFYYYRLCPAVHNSAGETIAGETTEYREILVPGEAGEPVGYIVMPWPGEQIGSDEQNADTLLAARVACDAKTVKIQFSVATKHGREILTASYDETKDLWTAVLTKGLLPGLGEGAGTVTLFADGKKLDVVDVRFQTAGGNEGGGDTGDEGDNGDEDAFFREGIWFKDIPEQVYTGKALKPETAVYDDGSLLTVKKDYTVTYKNNINAGTAKVVIKGKGNYTETVEGSFVIRPKSLDQVSVTVPEYLIFNNREQKINVTVKDGGKKLSAKKDFTQLITYQGAVVEKAQAAGVYEITLTGRGNYEGVVTVRCEVVEGKELLSKAVVKLPAASLPYRDGEEVTFDDSLISVKLGGKTVPRQEADGTLNYTVSYQDNKLPGMALVTITAEKGSHYVGSCSKKFKVLGTAFSAKNIDIQGVEPKAAYTGEPVIQMLVLTDKATGERLKEQVDYRIEYKNNVMAGKAGITLTGLGKYSGTIRKTFTITKAQLTEEMIETRTVTAQQNRAGATPDIEITYCGKKLVNGQDYTLSYRNNKHITTETKKAYITVTGKGNFTGRLRDVVALQIQPKSWQSGDITIEVPDMKYSRNRKEYKPVPVVCDNGRKLVKNKDYTVSYELNQKNDIGTIPDTGHTARVIITAKSADYADGTAGDTRIVEFRIMEKMIGNARVLLVDPQYFSRYGVKPCQEDLRVTYRNVPVSAQEYEILSYSKNDRKGKAVLVIGGKGQYGGTKKVTFVIRAKGMKTNLADAVSNAVSVLMELFA